MASADDEVVGRGSAGGKVISRWWEVRRGEGLGHTARMVRTYQGGGREGRCRWPGDVRNVVRRRHVQDLTNRLVDRATAYGTEVSTEKSNTINKSTNSISADIDMNGQKLEEVTIFKYMEATLCEKAPAQQKCTLELPQQWQHWAD